MLEPLGHRLLVVVVVTAAVGCGGGGAAGSAGGGGGSSGGIGGGSSGAGGAGASSGVCRRYLTQGTVTSQLGSGTASAAFALGTLTYTGVYSLGATQITQSRTYASLENFVTEPDVMGRILWTTETLQGAEQQVATCRFDANQRLLGKDMVDLAGSDATTTYSEWDAQGRPTRGLLSGNPTELDCANMAVTISYDDTTRRRTETIDPSAGSGTACPGNGLYTSYEVVDTDGNVIEMIHPNEAVPTVITITQTVEQCLP